MCKPRGCVNIEMEGVVGCPPLFRAGYLLGSEPPPSRQPAAAGDRVATGQRLMGEVATDESDLSMAPCDTRTLSCTMLERCRLRLCWSVSLSARPRQATPPVDSHSVDHRRQRRHARPLLSSTLSSHLCAEGRRCATGGHDRSWVVDVVDPFLAHGKQPV